MSDDVFQQARESVNRSTVERLFPGGEWRQGEYWIKNPLRPDQHVGSFSISEAGLFHDFATDDRGDLVDLTARARGIDKLEAARLIIETGGNGHDRTAAPAEIPASKKKSDKPAPIIPIPADALPKFKDHARGKFIIEKNGEPVKAWQYNHQGAPWMITARHEKGGVKTVIPYHYAADSKWHQGNPLKTERHLYNVDALAADTAAPVLVVEGEKCADIKVPGRVVITWPGGSKAVHKTDWTPLEGRSVTIWPDADDAGFAAALEIREAVPQVEILEIQDRPKGWDIADAVAEGIDPAAFIAECPRVKEPTTAAELFPMDTPAVMVPGLPNMPRPEKVKAILSHFFDFRYHKIRGQVQFRPKRAASFADFSDRDFNTLRAHIIAHFINPLPEQDLRMVIDSAFSVDYDPVAEYFATLPRWDGHDYIRELADLVEVVPGQYGDDVDAREVWTSYLYRWLIACCAQMTQKYENHTCLTLLGGQGIGKTTYLRRLGIADDLTYVGAIDPREKDSKIYYATMTLIVLDELEASTKSDIAALKSNMTLREIKVRRPYGRRDERLPRLASFSASANDVQILGDTTGSRRWLCVEVGEVDYLAVTPELVRSAYSQAFAALKSGVRYWFDTTEIKTLEARNQHFNAAVPEEEALFKIIHHPDSLPLAYQSVILTNTELVSRMAEKYPGVRFSQKKLGQVLARYGFTRRARSSDRLYGYEVVTYGS